MRKSKFKKIQISAPFFKSPLDLRGKKTNQAKQHLMSS
jgi:hypothetical protein